LTGQTPKVSIIIATYSPGDAINRVIESLDAQTLPQVDFEVIFVDDGSPDDTYDRLCRITSARPNMRVFQIANSGWPSRPRNVGIGHARGEYVMFMDHDDSLYPDGLRRAYEYAVENDADVLSPKESKTNDVWWGMSSYIDGNIPNALTDLGIDRMLPMVPHKLYRRRMLLDNEIRFPEGARVLWEDWFINIDAYRHSKVISVLADTPVYLWHASDTNSSHTFSPSRVDFWDRLEDMMAYIASVLSGPQFRDARVTVMAHQIRTRVIDRCVRLVANLNSDLNTRKMAVARARKLLGKFTSDEVFALLPKKHRAQLYLIWAGEMDLVKAFHEADLALTAHVSVLSAWWGDGVLHYEGRTRWEPKEPKTPGFRASGARVLRDVDPSLERSIPAELLDLTEDPQKLVVQASIRSRAECVTWILPLTTGDARFAPNSAGALSLVQNVEGIVGLNNAALGRPLESTVWDVRVRTEWLGMERKGPLRFQGKVMPSLQHGRSATAYSNASKGLSIDLAQRLRTLAIDAEPRNGSAGRIEAFSVPLVNLSGFGAGELDASVVVAIPDDHVPENFPSPDTAALIETLAAGGELAARIVVDGRGARLEGKASLPAGHYTLYARRQGGLHRTRRTLTVDSGGGATFG
jgi:glycosyltransferase involved in cell wall biosynthesis